MIEPLFTLSDRSAQVNAALIGIGGLILVAAITYWGVSRQIKSNRTIAGEQLESNQKIAGEQLTADRELAGLQLQHDADQQHINRLAERQTQFKERQLEGASAFGGAIFEALRDISTLEQRQRGALARDEDARNAIIYAFDESLERVDRQLRDISLLFGFDTRTGRMASQALHEAQRCRPRAAVLSLSLANRSALSSDSTPERREADDSRIEQDDLAFDQQLQAAYYTLSAFYACVREDALSVPREGDSSVPDSSLVLPDLPVSPKLGE